MRKAAIALATTLPLSAAVSLRSNIPHKSENRVEFDEIDANGDGKVSLDELKLQFPGVQVRCCLWSQKPLFLKESKIGLFLQAIYSW
jgi:hypothetical protein